MADTTVTDARLTPPTDADGLTLTADNDTVTTDAVTVIPARWDRHPGVTHADLTADGVDADVVTSGAPTPRRQSRHIRHRVTRGAGAALRGVRHLIRRHRHRGGAS